MEKNDVLLTYGWVRSSYAALRNLSNHNISVVASDSNTIGMCQSSRLQKDFKKYTSHYEDEDKFIKDILDICSKKKIRYILPSHNETEIIARHRSKFDSSLVSLVPNESHCKLFNNKASAYEFVKDLGISIPRKIKYDDLNEISEILAKSNINKTVIKLLTGNSSKGVFYGNNPSNTEVIVKDLVKKYDLKNDRYPQIEEYVEGEGYGVSVMYWGGKFIASFTHKRLREKIETGGTSTYRKSTSHKGIEDAAKKIFDAIGYNGLAMSEFKVCSKTGKYWFVEINPRMWGSMPLAIESGVEFPYLAWLCASQGHEAAIKYNLSCIQKNNVSAKWLLGEIFVLTKMMIRFRLYSVFQIVFKSKSDSIDDFFWDDPLVFFGQIIAYLKTAISKKSLNPSEKGMIG